MENLVLPTMKKFLLSITILLGQFFGVKVAKAQKFELHQSGQTIVLSGSQKLPDPTDQRWQEVDFQNKYYAVIHFQSIPFQQTQDEMKRMGIDVLHFLPPNAYAARLPKNLTAADINRLGIASLLPYEGNWKLDKNLKAPVLVPNRARQGDKTWIRMVPSADVSTEDFKKYLKEKNITLQPTPKIERLADALVPFAEIKKIAEWPFIEWIEPYPGEEEAINLPGVTTHRAGILQSGLPGQRNLKGEGVVVGVGDGGYVRPHFDFNNNRLQNMTGITTASYGDHGDHVAGTVGGAGVLNPTAAGMAPNCTMLTRQSSDIINAGVSYFNTFGMVLTNNSYGFQIACPTTGNYSTYTSTSNFVDNQLRNTGKLLHCFAASNDGATTPCGDYTAGFGTISLGFGTAKNALVVGAVSETDVLAGFSSRGPTADGRVKPEICGVGTAVVSTIPNNNYGSKQGTSMATPGVTGTLALLYQRFRQLNNGANPDAALIKAVACNTADDLGNANVDFRHGYGRINALRAVRCLESQSYYSNSISQGETQDVTLNLPAGQNQMRIMLYWHDREAASGASPALVNNLNLQVIDPSAAVFNPWVLDPSPANCNNPAVRGVDNVNNIEQVTISNPVAGNYTIRVSAPTVPFGPQSYYVVYEFLQPSISLTYPTGGEIVPTNLARNVTWNVVGLTGGTLILEYSSNGGNTWTTVNSSIAVTATRFSWTPGAGLSPSNNVILRIRHSTSGTSSTSQPFTLCGWPTMSGTVCDRHANLSWTSITGATSYEVFHFPNGLPELLRTINSTSTIVSNLTNGVEYYYAVRPVFGTAFSGERSAAVRLTPSATACPRTTDVGIFTISPSTGRQFTSTALSASQVVSVSIKNYGNTNLDPVSIPVSYRLNNGPIQNTTFSGAITSNTNTGLINFSGTQNMSAVGSFLLEAWTDMAGDQFRGNDTLRLTIRHLANPPIDLPITETFENLTASEVRTNEVGIAGSDAWDYSPQSANSRLRTAVYPITGNRGITLDRAIQSTATTLNYLIYTLNLSNHSAATRLLLNFDYRNHNETNHTNDKVWVRGTDSQAWVQVYDLFANQSSAGSVRQVRNLDLKPLLGAQTIGSSFQIRFGQEGLDASSALNLNSGYTFDNIWLVDPGTDLALSAITSPSGNCLSSTTQTLTVQVQNTSPHNLNNVPIRYQINNGTVVLASIPNLPASATTSYSFPSTISLTGGNIFAIRVWVDWNGPSPDADKFRQNDTATITVATPITTFPNLIDFEQNNGAFTLSGTNSSWAWGTPGNFNGLVNTAASGSRIWATNLNGNYNVSESSQLQSPCYNLSGSFNASNLPVLSFALNGFTEATYDFFWVEYSTNGTTWTKLGVTNGAGSTNWYNRSTNQTWHDNLGPWKVASYIVPSAALSATTRFRFVFTSDNTVQFEGVGIDDVHIVPNIQIHNSLGDLTNRTVNSTGSGNWLFFTNASGERIAGIQDLVNMGTVRLDVRQRTGTERLFNNMLYLNRNISIRPSTQPSVPIPVRYFFLESEVNSLRANDPALANYSQLKVTKYSGPADNLSIDDNEMLSSNFTFISSPRIVPYHNGYMAEFMSSGFSEFYLASNNLFQDDSPLPLELLSFRAIRKDRKAELSWKIAALPELETYRLEYSLDGTEFQILKEFSSANLEERLSDPMRGSMVYYRLAWKLEDGSEKFSPIRLVRFDWSSLGTWTAFPNPAKGRIWLANTGEQEVLQEAVLIDATGKKWPISFHKPGAHWELDISGISPGMYFLQWTSNQSRNGLKIQLQ